MDDLDHARTLYEHRKVEHPDVTFAEIQIEIEDLAARKRAIRRRLDVINDAWVKSQLDSGDPQCGWLRAMLPKYEWHKQYMALQAEDSRHRAEGKKARQWFLTFNPPSEISPGELWEVVTGYFRKNHPKSVEAAWARIEQRSEDPDHPHGWHMHVCVSYVEEFTRSVIEQRMRSVLDALWTQEQQKKDKKYFHKHWFVASHFLPAEHVKYMSGDKHHTKMSKVFADRVTRPRYGFPENLFVGPENFFPDIAYSVSDGISQDPPPQVLPEEAHPSPQTVHAA